MDRAELESLKLASRKVVFEGDPHEGSEALERALAGNLDPATRCELLLTRAVALQANDDPSRSANAALAAIDAVRDGPHWSLRATALAMAAGFVLRIGDLERSIDLAVDAMVEQAKHANEPRDAHFLRAHNALSVLFSRLAAFELAYDAAKVAWQSETRDWAGDVRSIVAYNLCSCGLARLRSDDCRDDERDKLVHEISDVVDFLCTTATSEHARRIVGPGMRAELALLGHADPATIDALDHGDVDALEMPAQMLAWHRLVRSVVARRSGELQQAVHLLDQAVEVLQLPAAEEHNLLRALQERAEIRRRLGDLDGAYEDLQLMVTRLHRAQLEQVGRMSVQIRHRAESEIARSEILKDVAEKMSIDSMTGVGTRRWLEQCVEELASADSAGAVIMLDLDRFKSINDTFGHATGDRVLAEVGSILRECLRQDDLIARYGGEEFVVFLPETSLAVGAQLAERIVQRFRSFDWSDMTYDAAVTISAGVAAGSFDDPWGLVETADQCMYRAKDDGRDRVVTAPGSL